MKIPLAEAFRRAQKQRRAAFIPYVTAGDPSPARTLDILRALERAGADILELGVPFTDPIADGPVNCASHERALAAGTTLPGVLQVVREFRYSSPMPVVLFSYYNPIHAYGLSRFAVDAAAAGVSAVLLTDVPAQEAGPMAQALSRVDLELVPLLAPTSTRAQVKLVKKLAQTWIYFVSRTGVTGKSPQLPPELPEEVRLVRKLTGKRVAVGFGVFSPEQVAKVAAFADGVVVGSALVELVAQVGDSPELPRAVEDFLRPLVSATRRS